MLEIRLNCENCDKKLLPNSEEAMICTFECTFCASCVETHLHNVCPNCGGDFVKRPIRPKEMLDKYPPKGVRVFKSVDFTKFKDLLAKFINVKPNER